MSGFVRLFLEQLVKEGVPRETLERAWENAKESAGITPEIVAKVMAKGTIRDFIQRPWRYLDTLFLLFYTGFIGFVVVSFYGKEMSGGTFGLWDAFSLLMFLVVMPIWSAMGVKDEWRK